MSNRQEKIEAFGRLLDVLNVLRAECPWDKKQTENSLRPNTIEEVLPNFKNVGSLKVRLFTPFAQKQFIKCMPSSTKTICVLDRCNTNSQNGEPLFKEVVSAISSTVFKPKPSTSKRIYGFSFISLILFLIALSKYFLLGGI